MCYLCCIYPVLVMCLAGFVYKPYMTSHRFVSTECTITNKSFGTNSAAIACSYITVLYHDPRQLNSTKSWNIGNLSPNETSLDENGWVCM